MLFKFYALKKPLGMSRKWKVIFIISIVFVVVLNIIGIACLLLFSLEAIGLTLMMLGVSLGIIWFVNEEYRETLYSSLLGGIVAFKYGEELLFPRNRIHLRRINEILQPYFIVGPLGVLACSTKHLGRSFGNINRRSDSGKDEVRINGKRVLLETKGEPVLYSGMFGKQQCYERVIEIETTAFTGLKTN